MTQLAEDNLEQFLDQARQTRGAAWLRPWRQAALERLAATGLPDTHQEEWRFTNINPIVRTRFVRPSSYSIEAAALADYTLDVGTEIVLVNGHWCRPLSRKEDGLLGVEIASLAQALEQRRPALLRHLEQVQAQHDGPFADLNAASFEDGVWIHLAPGTQLRRPIHLLICSRAEDGRAVITHPRIVVVAEEGSSAQIIETYAPAGGDYFTNTVVEVSLGCEARLEHSKMQQEALTAYHIGGTRVTVGKGAHYVSNSASLGSALTRNDLNVSLAGETASASLHGLTLIGGRQHVDNHTLLEHAQPGCPSLELYKAVLADRASGVFKGKILVRPGAQKTDSKQTSRTLLLSDDATMNAMPALEIYADDVKCTHGSTTGPLDEEQVFYLRSRGLHLDAARHVLTYAFAADVTGRIRTEPVRRRLEEIMAAQHGLPRDLRIAQG